ncbi:MAG: hypothetical protein AB1640_16580 [bacterium]
MKRGLKAASLCITGLFALVVVIPLALERFCLTEQWKTIFCEYHLWDQDGRAHHGYFSTGRILVLDLQNLQYGCELGAGNTPEGAGAGDAQPVSVVHEEGPLLEDPVQRRDRREEEGLRAAPRPRDVSAWRRSIDRGPFEPDYGIDGFKWTDGGYLWAGPTYLGKGRRFFAEGTRYDYAIPMNVLSEVVLPGAPIDVKAENLDILGKFPEYRVRYEDHYFKFDLLYKARCNRWYHWNGGLPFRVGDFGQGTMTEMPCDIEGTIVRKLEQRESAVKGAGVMEDAAGLPWSWFDWGDHNWAAISFPNGWAIGIWKAEDDWQWGYHRKPEEAWIWDAEKETFHSAKRVELLEASLAHDPINDMEYLASYHWRAYTEEGVLELKGKQLCFNPVKRGVPYTPFTFKESYGIGAYEGSFTRGDGATVELKEGYGTPEHFAGLFPDMFWICPVLLLLAILSWGGTAVAGRVERGQGYRNIVIAVGLLGLGVIALWWYWS